MTVLSTKLHHIISESDQLHKACVKWSAHFICITACPTTENLVVCYYCSLSWYFIWKHLVSVGN